MIRFFLVLLLGLSICRLVMAAEPYFVDLSPVANTSLEVDSSGNGGWLNQGINDMGIYPPIPCGETVRNGYRFSIIDAAKNHGNCVLLLKGKTRGLDKPAEATVKIPDLHARFLYILQNCDAPA